MKVCYEFWIVYLILLFVDFVELLRLVDAFFFLFMRLFWLFVFSCRTCVGSLVLVLCGHEWVLWY
jgi:hypothetical protein